MFGAFGLIIDLALILFGMIFIFIGIICGVLGALPKFLEWTLKLLVNPLFWIILFIMVFVF